jgi:lysyl endopeptidase
METRHRLNDDGFLLSRLPIPARSDDRPQMRLLPFGTDNVMMIRSAFTCFLLAFAVAPSNGQIAFGGTPIGFDDRTSYPEAAVVEFPAVDAVRLLAEDDATTSSGMKGPLRFGVNHGTDLNGTNSGIGIAYPDGSTAWRVVLHCPGAKSINLVFGEFIIPAGTRVFVWNEAGAVLGAFTQASSGGQHSLGVAPLSGERITVQFEHPVGTVGTGSLRITQVTHGYRDPGPDRDLGASGACNNNVICPEGDPWREQIASVAMIVVNGNGYCTGQLINNCANDGTPYFLTANHCLQGGAPANWVFRFNWASPTCEPTASGPTDNTVSGATPHLRRAMMSGTPVGTPRGKPPPRRRRSIILQET